MEKENVLYHNANENIRLGSAVSELKAHGSWEALVEIKDFLLKEWTDELGSPLRMDRPLFAEYNVDKILYNRLAAMGAVKYFFNLLDKYEARYLAEVEKRKLKEEL